MNFWKMLFAPLLNRHRSEFYDDASQLFKNIMFWIGFVTVVITVLVIAYSAKVNADSSVW